MHHYTLSGFDNVYLLNGYEEGDGDYGRWVSFEDGIDVALGEALIGLPRPLKGEELRVLRYHLGMAEPGVARVLGVSTITLRRWELAKDAPIDRTADRLFRLFYAEKKEIALTVSDVDDFLAGGMSAPERIVLEFDGKAWRRVFYNRVTGWKAGKEISMEEVTRLTERTLQPTDLLK
jgi:DNA-binding transcriptional regulator YiaG